MIIYKIENIKNNKVFIGMTVGLLKTARYNKLNFATNKIKSNGNYNTPLSKAIRKYGKECFIFREIDSSLSLKKLYKLRANHIIKNKSTNRKYGYNCQSGEDIGFKVTEDVCIQLSEINSGKIEPKDRNIKRSLAMKEKWRNPTDKMIIDAYNKKHQIGSRDIRGKKNPMYGKGRKGKDNPMYGRTGALHHMYGTTISKEQKMKLFKGRDKYRAKKRKEMLEVIKNRTEKECIKCKKTKPLNMYGKNKARMDKLESLCYECERKRGRIKYYKNKSPNKTRNRYGYLIKDVIEGKSKALGLD